MKSIIKRIVAVLVVMTICIGIAGLFADVVKGSTTKKKDDTIYTVLMLDLGGGTYANTHPETKEWEIFGCQNLEDKVKSAAKKYVEQAIFEGRNEQIAIVAYGTSADLISDFSSDLSEVIKSIDDAHIAGSNSNINYAYKISNIAFENNNITSGKRNIINFTKGFCGNGYYTSVGKYSDTDCDWYNMTNFNRFYACANAAYDTFEAIKDEYVSSL